MDITGVVIAGGKSRRMGFDKASIVFNNATFLQRSIDLLNQFTPDILISSNACQSNEYVIVPDEIENIGPLGGLYSCLRKSKYSKVFVVPVDMPLLDKEIITYLLDNADFSKSATIFQVLGRKHPLVGIYDVSLVSQIHSQIKKKDYKLLNLLQMSSCQVISGDRFAHKFVNVNSLDELSKLNESI